MQQAINQVAQGTAQRHIGARQRPQHRRQINGRRLRRHHRHRIHPLHDLIKALPRQMLAQSFGNFRHRIGDDRAVSGKIQRRQIKRIVGSHPGSEERSHHADERNDRRHDRGGRGLEAVADIAVEPLTDTGNHKVSWVVGDWKPVTFL